MKNIFLLTIIITLAFQSAFSDTKNDSTIQNGSILFFKDPRIDVLEKIYTYKKKEIDKSIRVHVFQATNRDAVFNAKAEFSKKFPGIPTFVSYQAPNFKLRAGEFANTKEAQNFLKQVKPHFQSSFVIEENQGKAPGK